MNSVGYLFVITAIFVLRQVSVGRAKDLPTDTKDLFSAVINMDWDTVGTVFAGRGQNVGSGGTVAPPDPTPFIPPTGPVSNSLLNEMVKLGNAASGYVLGSTGPKYYDCSGLVWRAMVNLKIYKGARFTTSDFALRHGPWTKVSQPAIGDIVLWATHHMGIVSNTDTMYSARSPDKGIGVSSISGDSSYFGFKPTYWRITAHA